ncbi:MAG: hypothetical protein DSZ07_08285 [Sulfurovum sp.]|nr:MAG: hypothetical protein DSZ07_08285 [Sulfurovum sp.]
MNKQITFIYLSILFFFGQVSLKAEHKESSNNSIYETIYTSIDEKDCQTLESDNLGSIEECESFAGMKIIVIEGDMKQAIIVIRDNKRYELDLKSVIPNGFISLGLDLKWIYKHQEFDNPVAMLAHLDVNEDKEDIEKVTSYSLVSKITEKEICIVGKIKIEKNKDKLAYKMAEEAYDMPCISSIK